MSRLVVKKMSRSWAGHLNILFLLLVYFVILTTIPEIKDYRETECI